MSKTAVEIAKERRDELDAVAGAFRDELKKRMDAWTADPTDEAAANICEAFNQLGAARRNLNQAAVLYRSLSERKARETMTCR